MKVPKIIITDEIKNYIDVHLPAGYEIYLFDITFDLDTPTVVGFMFGEAEFGEFVCIGGATRGSYSEAIQKVILEASQSLAFFRYYDQQKGEWNPKEFRECKNFEEHGLFYLKRKDLWHIFDKYKLQPEEKIVDFKIQRTLTEAEEVKRILRIMELKGYDVILKDLTTVDARQIGFHTVKVAIPQLIEMSGIYDMYYLGAKRLYEVPKLIGQIAKDYENLNSYPHPFP